MSDYYAEREANVERNKLLLESLGLEQPFFGPKETPAKKRTAAPKKRKAPADAEAEPSKAQRTDSSDVTLSGTRRSARNMGKKVDYKAERVEDPFGVPASIKSGVRRVANEGPLGREGGMRLHDPYVDKFSIYSSPDGGTDRKQFGSIPGIPVGTWWESR
jgi:E3 ubiquitin-protein ligase UHRF1